LSTLLACRTAIALVTLGPLRALKTAIALVAFFSFVTLRALWTLRSLLACRAGIALVALNTRHTRRAYRARNALNALRTLRPCWTCWPFRSGITLGTGLTTAAGQRERNHYREKRKDFHRAPPAPDSLSDETNQRKHRIKEATLSVREVASLSFWKSSEAEIEALT